VALHAWGRIPVVTEDDAALTTRIRHPVRASSIHASSRRRTPRFGSVEAIGNRPALDMARPSYLTSSAGTSIGRSQSRQMLWMSSLARRLAVAVRGRVLRPSVPSRGHNGDVGALAAHPGHLHCGQQIVDVPKTTLKGLASSACRRRRCVQAYLGHSRWSMLQV